MIAAIAAAREGARVIVVERMKRVGKKLLATGNGRCNITNTNLCAEKYHGTHPEFVSAALGSFGLDQTLSFFDGLGVATKVEEGGKVFPLSNQAGSVLDVLRYEMERLGVEIVCDTKIQIVKAHAGYTCHCSDGPVFHSNVVVVASGGKSAPNMGSNGGGYKICKSLGHNIVEAFPALVQVCLDEPFLKRLKGLKIDGKAELRIDNTAMRNESGEILFADYGISGPPIMQLSRFVSDPANSKRKIHIHLDLFPDLSVSDLVNVIKDRIEKGPQKTIEFSFVGFIHKRLIPVVLKKAGIDEVNGECRTLSQAQVEAIAGLLKDWPMKCSGTQSWMFSQVTAGGVDVTEINDETMESRMSPGLFLAGEVIDIDGDCGGYNLQWAWSSGHMAGTNAAKAALSGIAATKE